MERSYRLILFLLFLLFLSSMWAPAALAADALHGKQLYLNGPDGGRACAMCHTTSPSANVKNTLNAANNPARIAYAIGANLGNMGTLYTGRLSSADLADIAAFIANPNVTGTPAAALNPASLAFPVSAIGHAAGALAATLSNTGNAALNVGTISLAGAAAGDYALAGGTCAPGAALAPGASCSVQVDFTPSAAGARAATLVIVHDGPGGSSSVTLSGTGSPGAQATVALSATGIDFGTLAAGTVSAPRSITVGNTGSAPLTFGAIALGGANPGAFALGGTCSVGAAVPAGGSCTVTVTAQAPGSGAFGAQLSLTSNASNGAVAIALGGTVAAAAPSLTANPAALAFGAWTIGRASQRSVVLTNTGNVALTLGGIGVSGAASVTVAGNTCGATLAPGAGCTVTLAFAPSAQGAAAATLTVSSNAPALQVAVTGSGTTAPIAEPVLSEEGPLAFPGTQVGRTAVTRSVTLANGGTAALKVAALALDGAQAADFLLGGSCTAGASVGPGDHCVLDIAFTPVGTGRRAANAVLTTDTGARFTLALNGTGIAVPVPVLTVTPQSVDFGNADVNGTPVTRRITVANGGSDPAVLTAIGFTGPFALADGGGCAALPATLAPGTAYDLTVRFVPAGGGAASGTLTLTADGAPRLQVALSGSGAVPAAQPAPDAPASSGASSAPQNTGGGGCSSIEGGDDPTLAALVILSSGVLLWRRFVRKEEVKS